MSVGSQINRETQPAGKGALGFIFAVVLLDLIGLTLLIPITAYIVEQYSAEALMVTMMAVLYSAAQFVAAPILGKLSDRYGRRPVLLLSVLGSAVGYFLFGVGGALWVLFLSRLIDGFTGGNISTAMAYIADVTPPPQRAKNFALVGAAFGLGFILGPALGGVLSQISLAAPAYAAGVLSLLSAAVGFFLLPESLPASRRAQQPFQLAEANPLASIAEVWRRPGVPVLLVTLCLFTFVTMGFNSVAPVFLIARFGVQPQDIAGLLVVIGIVNAVVQAALMGRLVAAFGEKKLAVAGLVVQAVAVSGTVVVPSYGWQYPLHALTSGAAGPFRPAMSALLANSVSAEEQGKVSGVSASLASLMTMLGSLWAGAAYDFLRPTAPFWLGAILLLLGGLLLARAKVAASVRLDVQPVTEG